MKFLNPVILTLTVLVSVNTFAQNADGGVDVGSSVVSSKPISADANGLTYKQFTVSGHIKNNQKAFVLVDYKKVLVDCHGLNKRYKVNQLGTDRILVQKDFLPTTAIVCMGPATEEAQDGTKVEIKTMRGAEPGFFVATIMAEESSDVVLQIEEKN
jgi:hypothetical protein